MYSHSRVIFLKYFYLVKWCREIDTGEIVIIFMYCIIFSYMFFIIPYQMSRKNGPFKTIIYCTFSLLLSSFSVYLLERWCTMYHKIFLRWCAKPIYTNLELLAKLNRIFLDFMTVILFFNRTFRWSFIYIYINLSSNSISM